MSKRKSFIAGAEYISKSSMFRPDLSDLLIAMLDFVNQFDKLLSFRYVCVEVEIITTPGSS